MDKLFLHVAAESSIIGVRLAALLLGLDSGTPPAWKPVALSLPQKRTHTTTPAPAKSSPHPIESGKLLNRHVGAARSQEEESRYGADHDPTTLTIVFASSNDIFPRAVPVLMFPVRVPHR